MCVLLIYFDLQSDSDRIAPSQLQQDRAQLCLVCAPNKDGWLVVLLRPDILYLFRVNMMILMVNVVFLELFVITLLKYSQRTAMVHYLVFHLLFSQVEVKWVVKFIFSYNQCCFFTSGAHFFVIALQFISQYSHYFTLL